MKQHNSISVVLPSYNGMPLIKQSVESVLRQSFTTFELVICDDNSTDGTYQFLASINDSRVKLLKNENNLGLFPNLNNAIKSAQNDLIHLWAQDDIMLPDCLAETINFHNKHTDLAFAFSKYLIIDGGGKIIGENKINPNDLMSVEGHAVTSLVAGSVSGNIANISLKRSDLEEVGYFNEQMKYSGDFDMWCRLSSKKPVGIIQQHLIKLRSHSGQLSKSPKMWIYRLKENEEIMNSFLSRVSKEKLRYVKTGIKWRIYNQYFSLFIQLVKMGRYGLAKKYAVELHQQSNLLTQFCRWSVFNIFKLFKKEKWLLNNLYYKKL